MKAGRFLRSLPPSQSLFLEIGYQFHLSLASSVLKSTSNAYGQKIEGLKQEQKKQANS